MTQCILGESDRADILLAASCGLGGLSGPQAAHVRDCASCSQSCSQQAALWETLGHWRLPGVSSGFNRGLYARIESGEGQSWVDRAAARMRDLFSQPALAVASVAIVLTAGFISDHPADAPRPGASALMRQVHAPALRVSTTEAEQVEQTLEDLEMLRQFGLNAEEKETASKSM